MSEVQDLAAFVDRVQLGDLSERALEQLKIRVLDTIGVAIGALTASPIVAIGALTKQLGWPADRNAHRGRQDGSRSGGFFQRSA